MRAEVRESIEALYQASRTGIAIEPLTARFNLSVAEAYEIQMGAQALRLTEGRHVRGYKVGLTSGAMQRQLSVSEPDFGYLLDDMFYTETEPIPIECFIQPRIEPEIAFVLGSPLSGPGLTVADAVRAVDFSLPALEIIDSRIKDWHIGLADTVADNASSGAVVLGSVPATTGAADLRLAGVNLHRNGQLAGTGAGGAVLGNPMVALTWLANTLGKLGTGLAQGHVVLTGSCTAAIPVADGDTVTATIAGHGSVTAHFRSAQASA